MSLTQTPLPQLTRRFPALAVLLVAGALAAALLAVPAEAEVWVVTLVNESSFESRYQPIADPNDPSKIQLRTNTSNWISLPLTAVRSVQAVSDAEGFGRILDSATVELGFLTNDQPAPGDEEAAANDPAAALLQYFQQQDSRPAYTVEQFVEPESASGIPVDWTRYSRPPLPGER